VLVALRQGFAEPPTLVRVDPTTGEATKLSTFNDTLFEGVAWGRYESVTFKGSGGKDIQMWVNYPVNFDPAKKWPVYLLLHGGPHNGVKSRLVYYPNENHWILKPQNSIFWYRAKQDWLRQFIGEGALVASGS